MKNRTFLKIITLSVIVLALLVQPVSAKGIEYKANGKVTSYMNYDPENPGSSMVIGGNWNLKIKDGKVDFTLFYREMNLISEEEGGAPVGSVDHFTITLTDQETVMYEPGKYCYISGWFNVDKLAWLPEGSTPPLDHIPGFLGPQLGYFYLQADIEGNPEYMELYAGPWGLDCSINNMT